MSEFRKPFEYVEEKGLGGLLLFFFEMLLALAVLIQGYALLKSVPYLGPAVLVLGIAYLAFLLVACIALKRMSRHVIGIAKSLLVVRASRAITAGPAARADPRRPASPTRAYPHA